MSNLNDFNREAKAALWVALQWLLLAVPTGLVCGAVGTAFHLSVEYVTELRAAQSWLLLCLPLAGLAIVALYKVTKCEGVGTNNVIRAVQSGEPVSPLLVPAIFLGTVLTHLCGGSAGREGAALQMGGSIGWNVGKLLHLSDYVRRTATISGMAAFFSALFGTPLTAALFAMMVEDVGLTFTSAFMPAFTSALIAYGVSLFFGIAPTNFVLNSIPHLTLETALQTALLGIACAAVTRLFCWTLHTLEHGIPKRIPNPWLRAFAGGAAVVAFSYLFGVGRYNGAGMAVIADAVEQGTALPWDFLCKIFLTALTLAVGFKGGEVVPSFYIGATFGCVAGPLLGLPAGFAGAIGLVCVFCGATNALIPSILLGFELFSGAGLELIALGCGICFMLSGHHGLEVAVVDLRGPRRPLELEIALFGALAVRVSPLAHVGVALWSRSPCSSSPRPAVHRCASRYGAACEVRPNRPRERHRSMRRRRVRVRGAPSTSAPAPRATCRPYRRIWRRCCGSAPASSRSPPAGPPRRPSRVYH